MKNYLILHLTTEAQFSSHEKVSESSDESKGHERSLQIVRRALSRQTMSWNSKIVVFK